MLTNNTKTILGYLQQNARSSVSKIASETSIPVSTVLKKLTTLENDKIIQKYTTLLNYWNLKYFVRVNFAVNAKDKQGLLKHLKLHKNVNSLFLTKGDFDYYFETIFRDMAELYNFIESLDEFGLKTIKEHHIIEDVVKENFFVNDDPLIIYPNHMKK
jgi:Lrp/AsnC family transcriptional regulator, leucine-responsive regulatory protein